LKILPPFLVFLGIAIILGSIHPDLDLNSFFDSKVTKLKKTFVSLVIIMLFLQALFLQVLIKRCQFEDLKKVKLVTIFFHGGWGTFYFNLLFLHFFNFFLKWYSGKKKHRNSIFHLKSFWILWTLFSIYHFYLKELNWFDPHELNLSDTIFRRVKIFSYLKSWAFNLGVIIHLFLDQLGSTLSRMCKNCLNFEKFNKQFQNKVHVSRSYFLQKNKRNALKDRRFFLNTVQKVGLFYRFVFLLLVIFIISLILASTIQSFFGKPKLEYINVIQEMATGPYSLPFFSSLKGIYNYSLGADKSAIFLPFLS